MRTVSLLISSRTHTKLIILYPATITVTIRKIFGNAEPNYYLHCTNMTMPKSVKAHSEQHEH